MPVCPRCGDAIAHTDGIFAVCDAGHVWPCRLLTKQRARAEGDEILRIYYRQQRGEL